MVEALKNTGQVIALVSVVAGVWLMFTWQAIDPATFTLEAHPARFVVGLAIIGGGTAQCLLFMAVARIYEVIA